MLLLILCQWCSDCLIDNLISFWWSLQFSQQIEIPFSFLRIINCNVLKQQNDLWCKSRNYLAVQHMLFTNMLHISYVQKLIMWLLYILYIIQTRYIKDLPERYQEKMKNIFSINFNNSIGVNGKRSTLYCILDPDN